MAIGQPRDSAWRLECFKLLTSASPILPGAQRSACPVLGLLIRSAEPVPSAQPVCMTVSHPPTNYVCFLSIHCAPDDPVATASTVVVLLPENVGHGVAVDQIQK